MLPINRKRGWEQQLVNWRVSIVARESPESLEYLGKLCILSVHQQQYVLSALNPNQFLSTGIKAPIQEQWGEIDKKIASRLILRFDGSDAYWWLINAEQYFGVRRVPEEMKLSWIVAFAFEKKALKWWVSCKESNHNAIRWTFQKAVLRKYQLEALSSRFRN